MLFELEGYEDDLDYRSISLSTKTPCSEALPLIVKKFNLPGEASEYYLVEVSEENEGKASLALERLEVVECKPLFLFALALLEPWLTKLGIVSQKQNQARGLRTLDFQRLTPRTSVCCEF